MFSSQPPAEAGDQGDHLPQGREGRFKVQIILCYHKVIEQL